MKNRADDLQVFYELLRQLEAKLGGKHLLQNAEGRMNWPQRGVCFFYELGETRQNTAELRVVRVCTHAVTTGSSSTLWNVLSQDKGAKNGSGNHRLSSLRHQLGMALIQSDNLDLPTWSDKDAGTAAKAQELLLEEKVSEYLQTQMPFIWLGVDDAPNANSQRGIIEKNAIALLAGQHGNEPSDAISNNWLGQHSNEAKIRHSGLWNLNFVGTAAKAESYNPDFLEILAYHVEEMES